MLPAAPRSLSLALCAPSPSRRRHRPSLLRCRAFKQEGDRDSDPSEPEARKRRKGPLYKLKAAIQGLAGSRSAAAEVYGGEYQRAIQLATGDVLFDPHSGDNFDRDELPGMPPPEKRPTAAQLLQHPWLDVGPLRQQPKTLPASAQSSGDGVSEKQKKENEEREAMAAELGNN